MFHLILDTKNFYMKRVLLSCAVLSLAQSILVQSVYAQQQSYSLKELIQLAEKNPSVVSNETAVLKSADLKLSQVSAEKWLSTFQLQAFTGVVPNVDAGQAVRDKNADELLFSINSNDLENDFSLSGLGPFGRVEVQIVQPLYTWGKISGYESMAKANRQLSGHQVSELKDEVRFQVKRAFYTYLFSSEALSILDDVKAKLKGAEDKVEELLIKNSDNVEENDRLKIRVFQADVENRSLDAVKGKRLAQSALVELSGITGDWIPEWDHLQPEAVSGIEKENIISQALRGEPKFLQLEKLIEIKKSEKRTIEADLYPTLFLAGEFKYAVAPNRTDIKNPYLNDPFNTLQFGAALGIKQDLGFHRTFNKIEQIDAEIMKLESKKAQLGAVLRLEAEESFEKAIVAQAGIEVSEKGFRAARSWLTSTGLAFNLGTAPTKDVLESYAAYFKARVDLLQSIYRLNMAISELSQNVGVELVDRLK